jgi:hypothetical protein
VWWGSGLGAALALYAAWTLATWLLEGRLRTLLRPEAALDRATYTLVANLVIGTVAALWLLGRKRQATAAGGGSLLGAVAPAPRLAASLAAGLLLGFGFYLAQGAPSGDPIVVANAFAQVLPVSIAEVLVCFAMVGGAVEAALRARGLGRGVAATLAVLVSAVLFGLYHIAHSPPFDQLPMVALLTGVGLATGVFLAASRDLWGTIAFHNWLAVFGVVQALASADRLATFAAPHAALTGTALLAVAVLAAGDALWLRREHRR